MEATDTPKSFEIDTDSIENLTSDEAFRAKAREMRQDIAEQKQERTPTTGSPSKAAKQAKQAEELMQAVHPLVDGLNAMLARRWPGLQYTDGQVDFVSTLSGKIMSKYVDISAEKYGEEIALGMFLLTTGAQKGIQIYQIEMARETGADPRRDRDDQEVDE